MGRSGRLHTMRRPAVVATVLLSAILGTSNVAAGGDDTLATGGAGGLYPPGTVLNGVSISGLQTGFGVEIHSDGSALGQFAAVLIGVSPLGLEQDITIEGEGTAGSRSAADIALYSGTASVDMGDGLPATPGVPFTVTVATDADGRGTIGLMLGLTTLPSAAVNAGSVTVE
jgi:hypothetical protein